MKTREITKWTAILHLSVSGLLDKRLAKFGVNSSQFFYIFRICQTPGITRENLQEIVYRNPSNVTRALMQLEEKGYIIKETSKEDKRTCCLYPTQKGIDVEVEIAKIRKECLEEVMESFTDEECEVMNKLLKRAALKAFEINKDEREKKEEE